MIGLRPRVRVGLRIGVSMIDCTITTRQNTKRNQSSQLRRGRIIKTVLTHVARCGLEYRQQTTTRFLIGSPRGIRSRTHTVHHADADDRRYVRGRGRLTCWCQYDGRGDSSAGRGQLRRGRMLNSHNTSFDPPGTLRARAATTNKQTNKQGF